MVKDLNAKEKIIPVYIEEEMKNSYLSYAMSVIVGRALPDVRDGLKPVHRRILFAMHELNLEHTKPYKKSARIVGEVLGKYHPHGDVAVYDALVRMVQDFSLRYPLIDGQGNFGSVDGDAPAAMRYTEARLAAISDELLRDIEKETVKLSPNFDASLSEPAILPAALPNLLVNGSSGIAVGMATNMPPHNLSEVIAGVSYLIDNPEAETKDLLRYIKGPDFPTGGIICGRDGIKDAYATGRGKLTIRAKATIERQKGGKDFIVVTEIPYQVNKASLIEAIADLVQNKTVDGITDIRDESDKEGIRVVVELRRDTEPQIVLNQLYKHTQLETTFGIINLALVDGRPKVLNLKQLLTSFVEHREDIIRKRTRFDLEQAQRRAHILEGLKIALKFIDRIIKTIKTSKSTSDARNNLMKEFALSEIQAQAILEMQLQRLTALERDKIDAEYLDLIKKIELYKAILASEKKVLEIIKEELAQLKKQYGDERRTEIIAEVEDIEVEDLIVEEDMVITLSHAGYIKRLAVSSYRKQKRGGRGVTAMETKEEDFVKHLFIASTKDYLLFFTNKGKVFWLKVYEIPQASRAAKGKAMVNLLQLASDETISSVVAVKDFSADKFLVMVTKSGSIKKTSLDNFSNPRKAGIVAITLEKDDRLVDVEMTDGKQDILLASKLGKSIRFKEQMVRVMGRQAQGVRALKLDKKDEVIGLEVLPSEIKKMNLNLLTVTAGGFAKRTDFSEYRLQSRGGKGIINIKVTDKNGAVVGIKTVAEDDEIMTVTQKGMIVRCLIKDIRKTGRNTQGVKLISLEKGDCVTGIAKVVAKDEE
ncbi:MAG: DNA gyrase subunit A [Candidatus Omnitrophota bacterium]